MATQQLNLYYAGANDIMGYPYDETCHCDHMAITHIAWGAQVF
ncbi:hypothetical protein GQ600_16463 [Phytophthora cactorum]|nr:hypothetical protein GQ600_16463 [Phytophthora cactorum]